jgi:hypothetical protein
MRRIRDEALPMVKSATKARFPWGRLALALCVLLAWAGYRGYEALQGPEEQIRGDLIVIAGVFCAASLITIAVFWYAHWPEIKDR